jgi:hypothetical protein
VRALTENVKKRIATNAGSRGHDSRLSRFFLGSVSSYLVHNSASTVLVVRPPAQEGAMAEPLLPAPPPEERAAAHRKVAIALDAAADTARAQVRWAIKYVLRRRVHMLARARDCRHHVRARASATMLTRRRPHLFSRQRR